MTHYMRRDVPAKPATLAETNERAAMSRVTTRWMIVVLATILLVQALLVSNTFPLSELFTEKPRFHNDAAFNWYQMKMMVNLAASANLTGYDPFFNAGYIGGIHTNPSAKGPAAAAVLLHGWMDEIVVYKLLSF